MPRSTVDIESAAPSTSRRDVAAVAHRRASRYDKQKLPGPLVTERAIRILWIDDDLHSDDGSVVLLGLQGLPVECATSGGEGLQLALARRYAGIILDLRLPDVPGLRVLGQMAAADVAAPVLVLTGFGDTESAVAAMKLGATDFKEKPLIGDELIQAVRALVGSHSDGRHTRGGPSPETVSSETSSLAVAARHLARQDLTLFEFIPFARAFRASAVNSRPVHAQGSHPRFDSDTPVLLQTVLTYLESAIADKHLPSESDCAVFCDVTPHDLSRVLRSHLRIGFNECRRQLRIRPTVREVAFSSEQMAQIAFRHGYEYSGQFSRDFHRTFGLTPKQFRRLCLRNGV